VFTVAAFVLASSFATASGPPRHVLLLYSYEREFASEAFAAEFRVDLLRSSPAPIDFIELALQPTPTSQRPADQVIVDELRSTFGGRHLDLVVPMGGPAVEFAHRHRNELFPSAPVLLASVDNRFVRGEALTDNETAVTVRHDLPQAVDSILRVLPDTRTVVVVIGASPLEAFWVQEAKRAFRPFEPRLTFIWTHDWTYDQLLARSAHLPPHTVILFGVLLLDARGVPLRETDTLDALHATANAPIFGMHSPQLGHGIVGGSLLSYEVMSQDTSAVALRLLNGESAHAIPVHALAAAPMFDARELRRWGIAERRLQAGSVVRFRDAAPLPAWVTPVFVTIGAVTLLGFAAIMTLPRRASRLSADAPQDSTAMESALGRLTQRLMCTREEERASLARCIEDDVCQKLVSLSMDLHARGEDALCDHVSEIARESLTLSDPTYAKLSLLGLAETARTLAERRAAESNVALEFTASDIPKDLPRDLSIAMFRVFEHALDNALRHSKTRRLTVSLRRASDVVVLDVVDFGIGFDPAAVRLDDALGLVAMRERLQPVGGACVIDSRAGAGTRVRAFARVKTELAS